MMTAGLLPHVTGKGAGTDVTSAALSGRCEEKKREGFHRPAGRGPRDMKGGTDHGPHPQPQVVRTGFEIHGRRPRRRTARPAPRPMAALTPEHLQTVLLTPQVTATKRPRSRARVARRGDCE